ncbi:MAG: queuine tRNA-ribosyltransferase family protein [Endomicrobium sp.]|nr:queuine tRNA-ribosyltransferase family protein [Endomicrobium sp.]
MHFMVDLMTKIRKSLGNDTFLKAKKEFFEKYYSKNER